MTARKRKQGQQRRLKKYIVSQTGATNTSALLAKNKELVKTVKTLQQQIDSLQREITVYTNENNHNMNKDNIAKELFEQKKTNCVYLMEMKEQLLETITLNQRIYSNLMQ